MQRAIELDRGKLHEFEQEGRDEKRDAHIRLFGPALLVCCYLPLRLALAWLCPSSFPYILDIKVSMFQKKTKKYRITIQVQRPVLQLQPGGYQVVTK
jgi:hypothetical protein